MSNFQLITKQITFKTKEAISFTDLSVEIQQIVLDTQIKNGIIHVFAPHATGILVLTENDPALLEDIKIFLKRMIPEADNYNHPSNAHAHLRSIIFPPDKTLPIIDGQVAFGTWQSLLFIETDVYPRKRTITIQILGQ